MAVVTATDEVREAELRVCDTVGALMEFWGFKRPMGRIWTLLFLSPEPLPAAEIGERLAMSSGGVSMAVAELQKWGVVRRTWKPGDRRDFFEAETNVWKMVSRVFRERELALIRDAASAFAQATTVFSKAARSSGKEQARRLSFARNRVGQLAGLAKVGESIVSSLVSGNRVDTKPLREFDESEDD